MRDIAACAFYLATLAGVPGALLQSPFVISLTTVALGIAFVARDISRPRLRGVEPITLYAVALAITGFANALGFRSIQNSDRSPYLLYASPAYFPLAALLLLVGGGATIIGYRAVTRSAMLRTLSDRLPVVRARVGDRTLIVGGTAIAAIGMAANFLPTSLAPGTLGAILRLAPSIVVFAVARVGFARENRRAIVTALVIAAVEALRGALFAYLRSTIIVPLFAFVLGALVGKRSLSALRSRYVLPIYGAAIVFALYFAAMGRIRTTGGVGIDRLAKLAQYDDASGSDSVTARKGLMVRLTSFNQLSQVGRLVATDGFAHGQTLEYLGYAFIPRFLWSEKPKIAKGAWFAYRIGLAYIKSDGNYSNSINMTVPGELYLNFGWLGVVTGSLLFGAILAILWSRSQFWMAADNTLGSGLGFYLFWVGFGLGADLQIIVTLLATYLVFVAIGVAAELARRGRYDGMRARADGMVSSIRSSAPLRGSKVPELP